MVPHLPGLSLCLYHPYLYHLRILGIHACQFPLYFSLFPFIYL